MKHIIFCFLLMIGAFIESIYADLAEQAEQAILMEADTGQVLFEKNADALTHPSSMTKIVTVLPVFERLRNGQVKLTDRFRVSERAWRQEGSRMFLEPNKYVGLEDLLRGIIVQSGNDATTVIAESLSGTEEQYAKEMNQIASDFGATNTHFVNASGLPHEEHLTTARDLAKISRELIRRYPEYYRWFAEKEFTYNKIRQGNRNPLLYYSHYKADGIKTGVTDKAGHGLVGSAVRDDMRLIVVVNGTKDVNARARASDELLQWGFSQFKKYRLFRASDQVGSADVWLGKEESVPLVIPEDVTLLLSYQDYKSMKIELQYESPIPAPIEKGQRVATLYLLFPEKDSIMIPVVAGKSIETVNFFGKIQSALRYIVFGGVE